MSAALDALCKLAFVQPQPQMDPAAAMQQQQLAGDPAAAQQMGGSVAPPISDPAYLGGAPAGAPPADPAAAGQAPPPEQAAPAPSPGGMTPDQIRQLIQQEIQAQSAGAAGAGAGAAGAKPKGKGGDKADLARMKTQVNRTEKLLINLNKQLGLSLPYDILDEPEGEQEGGEQPKPAPAPDVQQGALQPIQGIQPAFDVQQPAGAGAPPQPTKQAGLQALFDLVYAK